MAKDNGNFAGLQGLDPALDQALRNNQFTFDPFEETKDEEPQQIAETKEPRTRKPQRAASSKRFVHSVAVSGETYRHLRAIQFILDRDTGKRTTMGDLIDEAVGLYLKKNPKIRQTIESLNA